MAYLIFLTESHQREEVHSPLFYRKIVEIERFVFGGGGGGLPYETDGDARRLA